MAQQSTKLRILTLTLVVMLFLGVGFQTLSHRAYWFIGKEYVIPDSLQTELLRLGKRALESKDAPVAAVLLYKGTIIGRGYNTAIRDTNIGEHAEINAISDALKIFSRKEFSALSRDSLVLITTYEPCLMCQGALLEHNIKKVIFLKPKPLFQMLKNDLRAYRYLLSRTKGSPEELQDSLFLMHPDYPKSPK